MLINLIILLPMPHTPGSFSSIQTLSSKLYTVYDVQNLNLQILGSHISFIIYIHDNETFFFV